MKPVPTKKLDIHYGFGMIGAFCMGIFRAEAGNSLWVIIPVTFWILWITMKIMRMPGSLTFPIWFAAAVLFSLVEILTK